MFEKFNLQNGVSILDQKYLVQNSDVFEKQALKGILGVSVFGCPNFGTLTVYET